MYNMQTLGKCTKLGHMWLNNSELKPVPLSIYSPASRDCRYRDTPTIPVEESKIGLKMTLFSS